VVVVEELHLGMDRPRLVKDSPRAVRVVSASFRVEDAKVALPP